MNTKYFLSVVVCCYNKEDTLEKTLDSIIEQSLFKYIEVVCIDDCSTDASNDILNVYAEYYDNIKVYKLPVNSSVFVARLEGIKRATAPYLSFIDPDDWVDPNYYLEMIKEITHTYADILITPSAYRCSRNKDTNELVKEDISTSLHHRYTETGLFDMDDNYFKEIMTGNTWMTLWSMMFKTDIIRYVLRVAPTYINFIEDNLIFTISLLNSKKICHYKTNSYYYYYNGNDTSHLSWNPQVGTSYKYIEIVYDLLYQYSKQYDDDKHIDLIKECHKKYIARTVVTLYRILVNSKGYKLFFTEEGKPKENTNETLKNEENRKLFESITKLVSVIKELNDRLKDNA